jgi:hypothetical protein
MKENKRQPQTLLLNIAKVAQVVSDLEITHSHQLQFISALNSVSWYQEFDKCSDDCSHAIRQMVAIGKTIESGVSSKSDVLFPRVCPLSCCGFNRKRNCTPTT